MNTLYWGAIAIGIIILGMVAPIFTDPFHQETRGLTFFEWANKEIIELQIGEQG